MSKVIAAFKDKQYYSHVKKTFESLTSGILLGRDVLAVFHNKKLNLTDRLSEEQKKEIESQFSGDKEKQVFALEDILSLFREKGVFESKKQEKQEKKVRHELIFSSPSFQAPTVDFQKNFDELNTKNTWFLKPASVPVGDISFLSHPIFWKKPVDVVPVPEANKEKEKDEDEEEEDAHREDHSSLSEDVNEAIKQKEKEKDTYTPEDSETNQEKEGDSTMKERESRLESMEIPPYISLSQLNELIEKWTKFERTVFRVADEFKKLKQDENSNSEKVKIWLLHSNLIGKAVFSSKNAIHKTHLFQEWEQEVIRMNKENSDYEKAKKAWKKNKHEHDAPIEPEPVQLNWTEITNLLCQELIPLIPSNRSLKEMEEGQENANGNEDSVSVISTNAQSGFFSRIRNMFRSNTTQEEEEEEDGGQEKKKEQLPPSPQGQEQEQEQEQTYEDFQGHLILPVKDLIRLVNENNTMKAFVTALKESRVENCLPPTVLTTFQNVCQYVDDQIVTLDFSNQTIEDFKTKYGDAETQKEADQLAKLNQDPFLYQFSVKRSSMTHELEKNKTYGQNEFQMRSSKVALSVAAVEVSSTHAS